MEKRYFVTGDCHGDFYKIVDFCKRMELTDKDTIIVLGDMGLYWRKDRKDMQETLTFFQSHLHGTQIWFIDGNHENFKLLGDLPDAEMGLKKCSTYIRYIPRGTELDINGNRCLFVGGADSVDKFRRIEGLSWWSQEQIKNEDIENVHGHYNYVFTHACPYSIFDSNRIHLAAPYVNQEGIDHTSENLLEEMKNNISFDNWMFGHYHNDIQLNEHFRCIYNDFIEII